MSRPALFAALLALPLTALAAPQNNIVLREPVLGSGCPIGLSVERSNPVEVVNAEEARAHLHSQRIRLTLLPADNLALRHVELVVHSSPAEARLYPAATGAAHPETDRDFHLQASDHETLHSRDLWVDGIGVVLSVDLTAITYTDGTTWHPSTDSTCRAVPSRLMLVAATASGSSGR